MINNTIAVTIFVVVTLTTEIINYCLTAFVAVNWWLFKTFHTCNIEDWTYTEGGKTRKCDGCGKIQHKIRDRDVMRGRKTGKLYNWIEF